MYFCDTGLVCFLPGITNAQDLYTHPLRGALFETLIISEVYKCYYNAGKLPQLYFWRDIQGHEIDCIVEKSYEQLLAIEIKSSMTIMSGAFKELIDWQTITKQSPDTSFLVYAGTEEQHRTHGKVIPWNLVKNILF